MMMMGILVAAFDWRFPPIEVAAAIFGLISVILTARVHILAWPTGIITCALYLWVFAQERLYSDAILQVYFIVMSIYGWIHWVRRGSQVAVDQDALPVCSIGWMALMRWTLIGIPLMAGWGWLMATQTDAALPYPDAVIAVASLLAQYLSARKVVEAWLIWIAVDVLAVWVFYQKQLGPTMILYVILLVLAVNGYISWKARFDAQRRV